MPVYFDYFGKSTAYSAKYFVANGVILGIACHVTSSNVDGINKTKLKESDCDTSDETEQIEFHEQEPKSKENVTHPMKFSSI